MLLIDLLGFSTFMFLARLAGWYPLNGAFSLESAPFTAPPILQDDQMPPAAEARRLLSLLAASDCWSPDTS